MLIGFLNFDIIWLMDKDYLIKLTFGIHQTSQNWPEDNFLKFKIRSLANEILTDFILFFYGNSDGYLRTKILREIQEIQEDLAQIRAQKLIDRNNFLLFQKEYNNIKKKLEDLKPFQETKKAEEKKEILSSQILSKETLSGRQRKILNILNEKEKVQVQDLQKFFPGISKRTLRRDLERLLKRGSVKRWGEWNKVFYTPVKGLGQGRT